MAVDTYTNLQAEVTDWLNRADLAAKIPVFVRLLEAQIERTLRVREMLASSMLSVTSGSTALPSDFRGVHDVVINTADGPRVLEWAPIGEIYRVRLQNQSVAGEPRLYSVQGANIVVAPEPDQTYSGTLLYSQAIPRLTTTTQETNWLLDRHPDIYLFGTLMQAAPYLMGDERVTLWGSALGSILEEVRINDERETKGSSPLRARFKPYGGRR